MGIKMGRDDVSGKDVIPESRSDGDAELLDQAFENTLRGDPEALGALLSLIKTKYGQSILKRLKRHRGFANTATVEDVFQQTIVDFIEQVKSGALSELPEAERQDVVHYFQALCDRKLENLRKGRVDPLYQRHKYEVPQYDLVRDNRIGKMEPVPGVQTKTEKQFGLMQKEIATLDPFDRQVLGRYLDGVSYAEIAKETGQKVSTLECLVTRIKQHLMQRILDQSPTARLNHEISRGPEKARSCLPTADEILDAIEELPRETSEAITFVHVNGGTIEKLAKSLGDRGIEKAQARLKRGYESLSLELDLPFPDSFSLLKNE